MVLTTPSLADWVLSEAVSADDSAVQEVAAAGSDVVVAAVAAAADSTRGGGGWSNNKVLLAVLPPTLALLSVALGVWDNGNRDRAAAEAARDAAAVQAAKEQAAAQRAQELRVAELVLPKYERLLAEVHGVLGALHRCQTDIQSWQVASDDWSGAALAPPVLMTTRPDGSITGGLPVSGAPFLESCASIDETIAPFELGLDLALLVSSADLGLAASGLARQLTEATATALHLRAAVDPSGEFIDPERRDVEGRSFSEVVDVLRDQVESADATANELIDAVRRVQLLLPEGAPTEPAEGS